MSPSHKGNVAESKLLAAFTTKGLRVSVPWGSDSPYDLIIDDGSQLTKVQCKFGRINKRGCVTFPTARRKRPTQNNAKWERLRYEETEVDAFGVYCPDNETCYLVPRAIAPSRMGSLRVRPTKNAQVKGVWWAQDYELGV